MSERKAPTRKDMERAEREVGENLPDAMVGADDGDVRRVTRHDQADEGEPEEEPGSRH